MAADTAPWMNSSSGRCKHPDDFQQVGVTGDVGQGPAFHAACRAGGESLIHSKGSPVSWVGLPDTGIAAGADQLRRLQACSAFMEPLRVKQRASAQLGKCT